jgi:hypothetical protein
MNTNRTPRRLALAAAGLAVAALGAALPVAAQAGETVEVSVPMKILVSGTQHTDWHQRTTIQDGCTDGEITYTDTGTEDLGFRTAGKVDGALSTVHDDEGETYSRLDIGAAMSGNAIVALDANTHRDSHTTETLTGGHESECGGADDDPEPPLGPDCGTEEHTLNVRLSVDRTGNMKVSTAGVANDDPFKRCPTPVTLISPHLAEVADDTTTTITGQGDSRVATIVGRRTVHQPLSGGEAVTTVRWRVVLERVGGAPDDEESFAPASTPLASATPAAPSTAAAPAPARPATAAPRRRHRSVAKRRRHAAPRRAHRTAVRHTAARRLSR